MLRCAEIVLSTEEAFHQVLIFVEMFIVRPPDQTVALWWNDSRNAIGRRMSKNDIAIACRLPESGPESVPKKLREGFRIGGIAWFFLVVVHFGHIAYPLGDT